MKTQKTAEKVWKYFRLPIGLVFSIAFVLALILGVQAALSFGLGGLTSLLPGWVFGRMFLKKTGASAAKKIVQSFYLGEALKLLLTVMLFGLIIQWRDLAALWFFLGLIVGQCGYWGALVALK